MSALKRAHPRPPRRPRNGAIREAPEDCVSFDGVRRIAGRVPSSQIGYVNALAESHEGAFLVRTRDPDTGRVEFWVMEHFVADFDRFVEGLRGEFPVEVWELETKAHADPS